MEKKGPSTGRSRHPVPFVARLALCIAVKIDVTYGIKCRKDKL